MSTLCVHVGCGSSLNICGRTGGKGRLSKRITLFVEGQ
jgi:hypothetical protein